MYIEQNYEMAKGETGNMLFIFNELLEIINVDVKYVISREKEGNPLIEKTLDNGITINENQIRIVIEPQETENMVSGRYYHFLKLKDQAGKINTGAKGQFRLNDCPIGSNV